jgi:opacity protein-like surface antigen
MLVTLPVGQIRPFAGVGFGAITLTEAKVKAPVSANDAVAQAFDAISGLQTNSAFSYGGGVRYALGQRLDLRADVRQYMVFSVKGVVGNQVKDAIASQTGIELARDHTVRYNELSVGICARF